MPTESIASLSIDEMLKGKKVIIPGFSNKVNRILLKLLPFQIKMSILSGMVKHEVSREIIELPERSVEVSGYPLPASTSAG